MKSSDLLQAALLKQAFIPLYDPGRMAVGGGAVGALLGGGLGYLGNRLDKDEARKKRELAKDIVVSALLGGGLGAALGGFTGKGAQNAAVKSFGKHLQDPKFTQALGEAAGTKLVERNGLSGLLDTIGTAGRMARDPQAADKALSESWPGIVKEEMKPIRVNPFGTGEEFRASHTAAANRVMDRLQKIILSPYQQ